MGQETSQLIDPDTPPETLSERSLAAVAQLIKDGCARSIVVMTGAGISTAAGIPDFRSPKTGLYHNLARLNLPHPEAVFEIDFFRNNPAPFYILAKKLYPGNFSPTVSHAFIALLAKKGLLRTLFTQNIDCLERAAGVPPDKIIEAHGSFATQRCIECRTEFPDDLMREHVKRGEPPHCLRKECNGLVKPDIVFFGEQLPEAFFNTPIMADLVLVMGTSLLVQPFASLPRRAREGVPRVLFNLERVGDLGSRPDDVLYLGGCDAGVRKLADELGWRSELEAMWRGIVGEKEANRQLASAHEKETVSEDELKELVEGLENKLEISEGGKGEPDANLAKQKKEEGIGVANNPPPRASGGLAEGSTTGAAPINAPKRMDDGSTCSAVVDEREVEGVEASAERKASPSSQEEEQEKIPDTDNDDKSTMSREPSTEKAIAEEGGSEGKKAPDATVKANDDGRGAKSAL
ncbi:Sir2 histone deacetylase Hst2 [Parahypoxylon ruwenzoriense]